MTEELTGSRQSSHSTLRGSPFPPIAEYGFLSDCEVSALDRGRAAAAEWMCLPRMDSPSVFAAMPGPGRRVVPAGTGGRHRPGGTALSARDHGAGDDVGHPGGLGRGP